MAPGLKSQTIREQRPTSTKDVRSLTHFSVTDPKTGPNPNAELVYVSYAQPHQQRRKLMEQAHPELKSLEGPYFPSAFCTLALVSLQFFAAFLVRNQPWWIMASAAWLGGAFAAHSLWVLIHECTHHLVFRGETWNNVFLLINNLPHIVPSAVSFAHFHRLHHGKMNEAFADPDLPSPLESRIVGNSFAGKLFWLVMLAFFQCTRPLRFPSTYMRSKWVWMNIGLQILVSVFVWRAFSPMAFFFLLLSNLFCLGPHVYGGRWIAEHYSMYPNQETYSYYGPLNLLSFNIGYHNEHHDLIRVAWKNLPAITKIAPEFYSGLVSHNSYFAVLKEFLFNPKFSLETRVVRKVKLRPKKV